MGPLGGPLGDHVWASVEDGRLAPPGTHLNSAVFRWMFPSIHITAPRAPSTTSSASAPTAVELSVWEDEILMLPECQEQVPSSSSSSESSESLSLEVKKIKVPSSKKKPNSDPPKKKKKKLKKKIKPSRKAEVSKTSTATATAVVAMKKFLKRKKSNNDSADAEYIQAEPCKARVSMWNTETQSRLNGIHAPKPEDVDAFLAARPQYCTYNPDVHSVSSRNKAKEDEVKSYTKHTKKKRVKQLTSGSYWSIDPIITDPVPAPLPDPVTDPVFDPVPDPVPDPVLDGAPSEICATAAADTADTDTAAAVVAATVVATATVATVAAAVVVVVASPVPVPMPFDTLQDDGATTSSSRSPTMDNTPPSVFPESHMDMHMDCTAEAAEVIDETIHIPKEMASITTVLNGHDSVREVSDYIAPTAIKDIETAPILTLSQPAVLDQSVDAAGNIVVVAPIPTRVSSVKKKRPILFLSDCPGYGGKKNSLSDETVQAKEISDIMLTAVQNKSCSEEESANTMSILSEQQTKTPITMETMYDTAVKYSEHLLKQDDSIKCSYLEECTLHKSNNDKSSHDTARSRTVTAAGLEDSSEDTISDATTSVAYSDFNPGDLHSHRSHEEQQSRSTPRQTDLPEERDMQLSRRKRKRDRDCTEGRGCETNHIHIHGNFSSPESGEKRTLEGRRTGSSEKGSAKRRSREWVKDRAHDDSSTDHSRSRSRSRSEETNDRVYRGEDSSSSSDQYSSMPRALSSREGSKDGARGCGIDANNDKGDITSSDRGRGREKERERDNNRDRDRDRKWLRVRDSDRLGDEFRDLSSSDDTSPSLSDSCSPKKTIAN